MENIGGIINIKEKENQWSLVRSPGLQKLNQFKGWPRRKKCQSSFSVCSREMICEIGGNKEVI